jgi:small-conductance mechanosensitive channel
VGRLIDQLINDFSHIGELRGNLLWELALIAAALLVGLSLRRLAVDRIGRRLKAAGMEHARRLRWLELIRLTGPVSALGLLMVGHQAIPRFHQGSLIALAENLLTGWVLMRLLLHALRRVFPDNSFVALFGRSLASLIWVGVALHILGLLRPIIDTLKAVEVPLGAKPISLWVLCTGAVWVGLVVLAALWLGNSFDQRLMRGSGLQSSVRVGLSRLIRALLVLCGILLALSIAGIDLTVLSVFGGALGVGLGFGLQKIASNYVSGFIILFDRSIRIADLVSVESFYGEVREITSRYVVVRAPDGREAIVPNETLITSTLISHSPGGRPARIAMQVQIGYDTDLEQALALLREIASSDPRVLADPPPQAVVQRFADSGIDLELTCWMPDVRGGMGGARSSLMVEIWRRFKRAGIEIPYPQHEVRVAGWPPASPGSSP